jgi:hypothetical protein
MAEDHLLYFNAVKGVESVRKLFVFSGITYHFQDNYPGTGTKVFRNFMETNPCLDVAPVPGQNFLDFRRVLDPVLNVNPYYDMFAIFHHNTPFANSIFATSEYCIA